MQLVEQTEKGLFACIVHMYTSSDILHSIMQFWHKHVSGKGLFNIISSDRCGPAYPECLVYVNRQKTEQTWHMAYQNNVSGCSLDSQRFYWNIPNTLCEWLLQDVCNDYNRVCNRWIALSPFPVQFWLLNLNGIIWWVARTSCGWVDRFPSSIVAQRGMLSW